MAKRFIIMVVLAVTVIFAQSQAEAAEVHVGNYSDGSAVYLITESVNIKGRVPYSFTCMVRAGQDYLQYSFFPLKGSPYYRNSEGYEGYVNGGASPVAASIYRYVLKNW